MRDSGSKNQAPKLRGEFGEFSRKASRGAVSATAAVKIRLQDFIAIFALRAAALAVAVKIKGAAR